MPAAAKITSIVTKPYGPKPGSYVAPEINGVVDYYIDLPVADLFTKFPRNTHQRDEEIRNLSHLDILQPEHRTVQLLMGFDGRLALIDAHSRWLKWLANAAIRPDRIHVHVYEIVSPIVSFEEQELRLYENCDSRRSVKTSAHTIQGAMNASELELETAWLRAGHFAESIKIAARFVKKAPSFEKGGIRPLIDFFRDELVAFDGLTPVKKRFPAPFTSAALLMLRADPTTANEMLVHWNLGAEQYSANGKSNPLAHLERLRDAGMDGKGDIGKNSGKFPTNTSDADNAVRKIVPMMAAAVENNAALSASIPAWSRPQVKKLAS